jgi:hypothetical protein
MTSGPAESALDAELRAQSLPFWLLDLPSEAILLDAGVGSAGIGLCFIGQVAGVHIAESSSSRLDQLKRLERGEREPTFHQLSPAQALRELGSVDVLLLSTGLADLTLQELVRGVRPRGQVALATERVPGAARTLCSRLLAAGFAEANVIVAWPSPGKAFGWVDAASPAAWSTLQRHQRWSGKGRLMHAISTTWQVTARHVTTPSRWLYQSLSAALVIGRK